MFYLGMLPRQLIVEISKKAGINSGVIFGSKGNPVLTSKYLWKAERSGEPSPPCLLDTDTPRQLKKSAKQPATKTLSPLTPKTSSSMATPNGPLPTSTASQSPSPIQRIPPKSPKSPKSAPNTVSPSFHSPAAHPSKAISLPLMEASASTLRTWIRSCNSMRKIWISWFSLA